MPGSWGRFPASRTPPCGSDESAPGAHAGAPSSHVCTPESLPNAEGTLFAQSTRLMHAGWCRLRCPPGPGCLTRARPGTRAVHPQGAGWKCSSQAWGGVCSVGWGPGSFLLASSCFVEGRALPARRAAVLPRPCVCWLQAIFSGSFHAPGKLGAVLRAQAAGPPQQPAPWAAQIRLQQGKRRGGPLLGEPPAVQGGHSPGEGAAGAQLLCWSGWRSCSAPLCASTRPSPPGLPAPCVLPRV